jgi:7,8-dihydroneopterin aldolase/epimerase/oxygenase
MTTIGIHGLEIFASVGVSEAERETGHRLQFDLELELRESPAACQTDTIEGTVDYGSVIGRIGEILATRSWLTLEYIAETVAHALLREFESIQAIEITVSKPMPPVSAIVNRVSVRHRIERN